jgi:hypothetical protein
MAALAPWVCLFGLPRMYSHLLMQYRGLADLNSAVLACLCFVIWCEVLLITSIFGSALACQDLQVVA